jgi:hypothetical protein
MISALPWIVAVLLAAWCYVIMVVEARVDVLGRFDDGIEYTTVTYLLHGQIPYSDFYEPYGIGLGIPGVLPHLLGVNGVFALRLVYGLFPALVTLLVTPLVWRRCGPVIGTVVGLITITSTVPRYSMGFAALFGFMLMIDSAVRRTGTRSLRELAETQPRLVLAASLILSLAGWARTEYAVFAAIWAVMLLVVLPAGRRRWTLSLFTLLMAGLPTLIVLVTGGLQGLWWFISYTLSSSSSGFHAQRGQPIEWHFIGDRITELAHFQFGGSEAATIVGSYGIAAIVVIVALAMLFVAVGRRRLLTRDKSYLTPFFILVCAIVLYGQLARFSTSYGTIGNPIFWVAGALLVGRLSSWRLVAVVALFAYPFATGIAPGTVYDAWTSRPAVDNHVVVRGLNRIPLAEDGGAASMAALIAEWSQLGLKGRSTVSVELRNDVAWGNEAIVGYLLNAPAAAWPLTYDPGLVNTTSVEKSTINELCHDRAPVVQGNQDYPYPAGKTPYIGSRLLDEFLAVDYNVRAVAGFYRILLPSTVSCEHTQQLDEQALEALAERRLREGELAQAGALAIARMERSEARHEPSNATEAALAVLGGYTLTAKQVPTGGFGAVVRSLMGQVQPGLAQAAAQPWPTDIQRLAAQSAWVAHRAPGEAGSQQAAAAIYELAMRHANWPQAIANISAVQPPTEALFTRLAQRGANGMPVFDRWRRGYFVESGIVHASLVAGVALVEDYIRATDPVEAGQAELELATYPGVTPGCALALRRDAGKRPGMRVPEPSTGPTCTLPELLGLVNHA